MSCSGIGLPVCSLRIYDFMPKGLAIIKVVVAHTMD
jgi:hypothetical protein